MLRRTVSFLITIFFLIIILNSCTAIFYEKNFFYPHHHPLLTKQLKHTTVTITSIDSTKLRGNFTFSDNYYQSLIYFYGNGESVYETQFLQDWLSINLECNVLCIDYRGYGISEGSPSILKIMEDGLQIYDFLNDSLLKCSQPIYCLGYSLGTYFSTYVALKRNIDALILIAPFTSGQEYVKEYEKTFPLLIRLLVNIKLEKSLQDLDLTINPVKMIRQIEKPLLIIHGKEDKVVPPILGERMFENSISENKHLFLVEGKGHNDIDIFESPVSDSLISFIKTKVKN